MDTKKNFTIGVLSGVCLTLFLFMIMGSTTISTNTLQYEFHDLGDTRGMVFDKVTGEMEYKEIRTEPLNNSMTLELGHLDKLNLVHSGSLDLGQVDLYNKHHSFK